MILIDRGKDNRQYSWLWHQWRLEPTFLWVVLWLGSHGPEPHLKTLKRDRVK